MAYTIAMFSTFVPYSVAFTKSKQPLVISCVKHDYLIQMNAKNRPFSLLVSANSCFEPLTEEQLI